MKRLISAALTVFFCIFLSAVALSAELKLQSDDCTFSNSEIYVDEIVSADKLDISAPSAILIEQKTGTVIYDKNADEKLLPASVTKIMTILLIVEEVESGYISLDDTVIASSRAASMGGSQVYLKENEKMSVENMLKSIVVSSANDCAVAMAEHICGSESAFVERMNEKAASLGMENTRFMNCTGLLEQDSHRTTARDIAIMSRELLSHEWIRNYTTIWTDTIRDGEFGLSNTNKLIRFYDGATGLKTGYTSNAGYCLSASAERDGVEYIAVVLNCITSQERFDSAKTLLNYAFATYTLVSASPEEALPPVPVTLGKQNYVQPEYIGLPKILVEKSSVSSIEKTVVLEESVTAPVNAGDKLGTVTLKSGDSVLFTADITAKEDVCRMTFFDIFIAVLRSAFGGLV